MSVVGTFKLVFKSIVVSLECILILLNFFEDYIGFFDVLLGHSPVLVCNVFFS
jgi:hypothetical protein